MDDCLSGKNSSTTDQFTIALSKGGFRLKECNFPVKTQSKIVLGSEGRNDATIETTVLDLINELSDGCAYNAYMPSHRVSDGVESRYKYSQYLIDPNRFRYRKVVRVLRLVILFVSKLFARIKGSLLIITQYEWGRELPNNFLYKGRSISHNNG